MENESYIVWICIIISTNKFRGKILRPLSVSQWQVSHPCFLGPMRMCSVMSDSLWTPWTVACQVPLSMEFSRQEYCSGLPSPTLGDLLEPGIKLTSPGSCIGGHILYHCTSWEAPSKQYGTDAQIKGTWWRPQKQTHDLWSVNLQQRRQEYTLEGR